MSHAHLTYRIITAADYDALSQEQKDCMYECCHGVCETQRRSLDGTLIVVKWRTSMGVPENMPNGTDYSHSEILVAMRSPDWTSDEDIT